MCHGGICRAPTRAAIDLAQGRASSYVSSDIGAILSGRWHDSHFCWKIGATSLVKVTVFAVSAATAGSEDTRRALKVSAVETRNITGAPFELVDRSLVSAIIRRCRSRTPVSVCLFFVKKLRNLRLLFPRMPKHATAATTRT